MTKGVLLDVDGTLVLSNDAHAKSWVEAFGHFGYQIAYKDVRKLIGMGGDKLIPLLVPDLDAEHGTGKEISDYRSNLFLDKYADQLRPAPGSRALIQRLQDAGLELAVASSSKQRELSSLLEAAQVADLLDKATTSDDAESSKPDPDIVRAALDKIHLPAKEVLMIGDTPYDIEAAHRTDVGIIAVRCGGWEDTALSGALTVYDDPQDIVNNFESLPSK